MKALVDTMQAVMNVLNDIGNGKLETHACDDSGISVFAFRKYIRTSPELSDMFIDAEARGYDRMADDLANIHEWGATEGVTDVKMLTLIANNRKWLLAKRKPQSYGERSIVEHSITADRTIIEALSQGKQRALEGRVIEDAVYSVIDQVTVHGVSLDEELLQFVG